MGGKAVAVARAFPIRDISNLPGDVTDSLVPQTLLAKNIDFPEKKIPPEKSLEIVRSRFEGVCEIFLGPKDDFIRKFLRDDTTSGDPRPTDPPAARKDRMRAINPCSGPLMGPK